MLSLRRALSRVPRLPMRFFVNDKFMKERDEAAERVYITRQESTVP
jgi:hypothetical protein